jgi:hypothetical protein
MVEKQVICRSAGTWRQMRRMTYLPSANPLGMAGRRMGLANCLANCLALKQACAYDGHQIGSIDKRKAPSPKDPQNS